MRSCVGTWGMCFSTLEARTATLTTPAAPAAGRVALAFVAIRVGFKKNLSYWLATCVGFKSPRQHLLLYAWVLSESDRTG